MVAMGIFSKTFRAVSVVLALISFQSAGMAAPYCAEILSATTTRAPFRSYALPEARILTEKDKEQIHSLISDTTNKNRWEEAFQVYLDRRLSFVPLGHRAHLRERISEMKMVFDNLPTFDMTATHHQIYMSAAFKNTMAPWFMKAHEMEHIIQIYSRTQKRTNWGERLVVGRTFYDPFLMYRLESDAMRAEWEILTVTPESEVQRVRQVGVDTNLDPLWRDFFRISLHNRSLDREAYVHAHHKEGRYSIGEVASVSAVNWASVGLQCGLAYLSNYLFF